MAESISVGVRELRNNFSHFLAEVQQGAKVTVLSHGKPVAELSAPAQMHPRPVPKFGSLKGEIWIADDFDDPLPDFEADYYGDT